MIVGYEVAAVTGDDNGGFRRAVPGEPIIMWAIYASHKEGFAEPLDSHPALGAALAAAATAAIESRLPLTLIHTDGRHETLTFDAGDL